jgi:DNA-binding transcriptional MerR regulator
VTASVQYLNPAEAARRLGVSAKALRLYEQRGLVSPVRTAAGWRAYGPDEMARAAEIASLRALGLSLAQVGRVLGGDSRDLEPALAEHQGALEADIRRLATAVEKVRTLRAGLAQGQAPAATDLADLVERTASIAIDLPWPWGGERFELCDIRAITYIVGPLGSGKTRLSMAIAQSLPDGVFLGLERLEDGGAAIRARLDANPAHKLRVDRALAWLADDGATVSDALLVLVAEVEDDAPRVLVVDLVEQGLDEATQAALVAHLRRRGAGARPTFMLTRSCAILDMAACGPDEAILLCPANHSPPIRVAPYPGALGYEAVATCLASPEVRARTEGMIATMPRAAAH